MSLNVLRSLEPVSTMDPRIDFDTENFEEDDGNSYGDKYLVWRGPKNIDYFFHEPTTGGSSGNVSGSSDWMFQMPGREAILDRCIFLQADVIVNMIALANNADNTEANRKQPFFNNRFALQAFPLHHCIRTLQLQIDTSVYSVDLQDSFEHLKYYNYTEDEIKTWSSLCPTLLDNASLFTDTDSKNVLSTVKDSGTSLVPPRGAFAFINYGSNYGTNATKASGYIKYRVTEPIQLSPFILNAINQSRSTGLTGFSNIKIKITWKLPGDSFYSAFNINPYTSDKTLAQIAAAAAPVDGKPQAGAIACPPAQFLNSTTVTERKPNLDDFTSTLTIENTKLILGVLTNNDTQISPSINSYDFMKYETHQDKSGKAGAGEVKFDINTQSYNLNQIPHSVLLAVRPAISDKKYTKLAGVENAYINTIPDFYFPISNVNIKLGNRAGLCSNYTPQTLYQINRQNGLVFCNYSNSGMGATDLRQYLGYNYAENTATALPPQGCPLLLKFGKDIPIDDSSLSAGVSINSTIQFKLQCNNQYAAESQWQLVVMFIYDGIYTISNSGGASFVTSPLTREDVLKSDGNRVDASELDMEGRGLGGVMVGGNWMGKLKKIGKKAYHFMKNPRVQKLLRESINLGSDLGIPGLGAVDSALDRMDAARSAMGSGYGRGGVLSSSSLVGGTIMTADQLRRRLGR